MNFAGQFALGLITAALICSDAHAGSQATAGNPAGNPYAAISERNVFALVPIPIVSNEPVVPPGDPPPKITPNGIMSLFGQWQVLFKVAMPAKGKEPAKDMSYVMAEGERQDDIVVVKIDQPSAVITFNNHGAVQELPLAAAPKSVAAPAGNSGAGGIPLPVTTSGGSLNPAVAARLARAAGGNQSPSGNSAANTPIAAGTSANHINNSAQTDSSAANNSDPDVVVAQVVKNYLDAKKSDHPSAPIFPLTPADKKAIEAAVSPPSP